MAHALGANAAGAFAEYPRTDPLMQTLHTDEREAGMAARVALIRTAS
jgi:hypothetical protein